MYMPHGTEQLPQDLNVPIWRYMKFARFEDMLDRKSLFFSRPDSFDDKFEGMWGKRSREFLEETLRKQIENGINVVGGLDHQLQGHKRVADRMRTFTAINCWHQNDHESDAMWRLYVGSEEGVAVRSTIAKLVDCFPENDKGLLIHVGAVRYIDYDTEPILPGNYLSPFSYKRKSFEHEREVRAVALKAKIEESEGSFSMEVLNKEFTSPGEHVSVDLNKLIHSVYLAPGVPSLATGRVAAALEKSGLAVPVVPSRLDDEPV